MTISPHVASVRLLLLDRFVSFLSQQSDISLHFYVTLCLESSHCMATHQTVPEKTKESEGGPWEFVGLLSLFDPPRHDSAETIRRALNLGVNVKMITGDQLAIGKETGRRLGMGTNMYPSSSLLGQCKDESIASIPVNELIEKADGFAGVFPGNNKSHPTIPPF